MNDKLKVLFLAAEATPFAKVGGLADVAGSLPQALRRLGVDVRLLIPRYANIRSKDYDLRRVGGPLAVPLGPNNEERAHLSETRIGELPVYLLWNETYFSARERVYGFNDDPQRFTFFAHATLAALRALDWKPDVIHAHDWHTAPVVTWLDQYGRQDPFYRDIATLYTIHSLAYQGLCGRLILTFAQMREVAHLPVEPPGQVNWMAQGIAHADLVSTVSPTYAREILTPEAGMGLDSLLRERQDRLFGILNGIDNEIWNPESDPVLAQSFDADSLKMRAVNKAALQREVGLPARAEVPLLSVISRLDPVKGFDILLPALDNLLRQQDAQFVLLGTGEPEYAARCRALQERFPDRVRVFIRFDERLARRIYGGSDLFLMPSRFAPGSLGQLIAMRYGAIPLVRATGGLADTVMDVDAQPQRGTGFVFQAYTSQALEETLQRALVVYHDAPRWKAVQHRALEMDFSWGASACAYRDLYQRTQAVH
ncbi:MAG: glycogen synthase [Anaerolineae bacterium]|nr:glycogen synthase [Anaerolineae bacterium]